MKKNAVIRIALYLVAALFLYLGVTNGGMRDVMAKAVRICMECIGIG